MKRRDVLKALIIAPAAPAVIAKGIQIQPAKPEYILDHLSSLTRRIGPSPWPQLTGPYIGGAYIPYQRLDLEKMEEGLLKALKDATDDPKLKLRP